MDPIEKQAKQERSVVTLGELISYYYERFSEVYDSPELRDLAVATVVEDILIRDQDA